MRFNTENISKSLKLALQTEGIPSAVALVTDKKCSVSRSFRMGKRSRGEKNAARQFIRHRLND